VNLDEILVELEKLSPEELEIVQQKVDQLRELQDFEETPEMLAAIDEGLRSAREEPLFSIEEVREEMRKWRLSSDDKQSEG